MYDFINLVKRNILTFLRDKAAVFFSLLSVLILLALYFLFIGEQYRSSIGNQIDDKIKIFLSTSVIMGGVLVINTVSLSLGVMGNIINDQQLKKIDAFLVTPVKRFKIILAYYVTGIIITGILTWLMWGLTVLYVGIFSGYWYSFKTVLEVMLILLYFTFISSTLMICLTTLIKSVNAFGAMSGVLGTFIGFVSGIYIPIIVFEKPMKYVASIMPFTHMTIWLKNVILKEPYALLPVQAIEQIELHYGTYELGIFGQPVSMVWIMLVISICSFGLLYLAYRNLNKKLHK